MLLNIKGKEEKAQERNKDLSQNTQSGSLFSLHFILFILFRMHNAGEHTYLNLSEY